MIVGLLGVISLPAIRVPRERSAIHPVFHFLHPGPSRTECTAEHAAVLSRTVPDDATTSMGAYRCEQVYGAPKLSNVCFLPFLWISKDLS